MNATITYTLSPAGQRAALAANLPATKEQTAVIEVPTEAIDLFAIDSKGALSADLREGGERVRGYSYGDTWNKVDFDAILTAETAVEFLRTRSNQRAAVTLAENDAKMIERAQQAEKAAARRQADIETMRQAVATRNLVQMSNIWAAEISIGHGSYGAQPHLEYKTTDPDPEVAELVRAICALKAEQDAEKAAQAKKAADLKELIDSIPAAPVSRPVKALPDGRLSFTVPNPTHSGEWSKHVTSVDPADNSGMGFDGPWLKCGQQTALAAGDIIVVGAKWYTGSRKNGSWNKTRDLYIVTPAGVIGAGGNSATLAAELLAKDPAERVTAAIEAALRTANKRVQEFSAQYAPGETDKYAAVADIMAERRAAWCARRDELQAALDKATAPAPITSVAEAAAAIIAAGYKALAQANHPDKGGDALVMGLLTDARNQLREILALASN